MSLIKLSAASGEAQAKMFAKLFNKKPQAGFAYGRVADLSKHILNQPKELNKKFPLTTGLRDATNHLKSLLK